MRRRPTLWEGVQAPSYIKPMSIEEIVRADVTRKLDREEILYHVSRGVGVALMFLSIAAMVIFFAAVL